ncbi:MAG: dethiobiotin synthase [Nitrosomonadaceae bacterium]|jgi:dethiobiotin synthetase|nr:dethiobiotin synthase [Nitrosomonadaceae bacterium]TDI75127.1 MAG: dethiobiotin synthase [Betaproteobacteria bacterium]
MPQSYFITGTDTSVGKTLVSCALLYAFAARGRTTLGMKPIETGCVNGEWMDVKAVVAASSVIAPREWVNPYALIPPIAPHIAAKQAGIEIDIVIIRQACLKLQNIAEVVLVEGVGGFMTPLNDRQDGADMAHVLDLPVILVVGMRLGCLNHALVTAQAVQAIGLQLAGWVANQIDPQMISFDENVYTLTQRLNCPLLGVLPFEQNVNAKNLSVFLDIAQLD